ncbi:MAG: ankyrin repeat domain-containing protein [Armatimonadota bacterium]
MRAATALLVSLSVVMSSGCLRRPRTAGPHQAASIGSVSEVRRHIERGADVNATDRGWTPLAVAAYVEHGAKPTLASAAALGDEKTVTRLLDEGADPDEMVVRRFLPLHAAARHGHVTIVRQLLEADANPDLPDGGGKTARDLAEMLDRTEIMDLIEQHDGRGWQQPGPP